MEFSIFLKAFAATFARIVGAWLLFLIAYSAHVALQAMTLRKWETKERDKTKFRISVSRN